MKHKLIAQRYANAFLRNFSSDSYDLLLEDINIIASIFREAPENAEALNSYLFTPEERFKLTTEILDNLNDDNRDFWKNLFKLLIQKHKFNIIFEIVIVMEANILTERNQVKMILTVAHELPKDSITKIKNEVSRIMKKDIISEVIIDPAILGGFVAEAESIRIDGSIKNNLIKFQNLHLKNNTRSV